MPIRYKLHQQGHDTVLAAADASVLGQKHTGNSRVLDLAMFRPFYDGDTADETTLSRLLNECSSANLAGKKSVGVAIALGLAREADVLLIGGVPHLQLYRVEPQKE
jgi:hypothetical protein